MTPEPVQLHSLPSASLVSIQNTPSSPQSPPYTTLTHQQTEVDDTLQEQTMVESEEAHGEIGDEKRISPIPPLSNAATQPAGAEPIIAYPTTDEKGSEVVVDPLRAFSNQGSEAQELTVVVEDSDVADTPGGTSYPISEKIPPSAPLKRASHLRLDLKPPSPQPWDILGPPESRERKSGPDLSTMGSRKFHTLQSTTNTHPSIPKSSYYFGPPPDDAAFGTPPIGQIGVHHPREIIRIERDYTGGELVQFAPIYPLELDGRITPTHFLESINAINELLISAHSLRHSFVDNTLAILTLQISRLFFASHYDREMLRLQGLINALNAELYNPVGLNILWPRNVAFLFLEIEYY